MTILAICLMTITILDDGRVNTAPNTLPCRTCVVQAPQVAQITLRILKARRARWECETYAEIATSAAEKWSAQP